MRDMILGGAFTVLLGLSATDAQAQVGSNAYGGVCFGAFCDPRPPVTGGGTNAFGGNCLGAYCNPPSERESSTYQPYPTAKPDHYAPTYSRPAPNPFSNSFGNEEDR
jgi:hypothetical protein